MAQTDKSIRMTPNANMYTRESKTMFNENKTGQWISEKTDEEKSGIIKDTVKEKPRIEKLDKMKKVY